jgi:DHA1 family bicyclomycin/chloramphenicol resistance-like MFS transporter/DHA1 family 2-module integral membrane pump EmrD-like MFS transporter
MVGFFKTSASAMQLSISAFLLALGIGQVVMGPLSDRYGRRIILIVGITIYLAGTAVCIVSDTVALLMIGRALQGLGIASCAMTATTLIGDCFEGDDIGRVTSYFSLAYGLVPILSPVIGGHIQDLWGWQANFGFMFIFAAVAFALIIVKLPETHAPTADSQLHPATILKNYVKVLGEPRYMSAVFGVTVSWSTIISFSVLGPFLLQNRLGYAAYVYGWSALFVGLGFFVGNLLNTHLLKHHQPPAIFKLGLGISFAGGVVMAVLFLAGAVDLITVMAPTFIVMTGIGLRFPNYYGIAVGVFTDELTGVANALIGALVLFGTVIYTLVLTAFDAHAPLTLAGVFLILGALSLGAYLLVAKLDMHTKGEPEPE